MRNEISYVLTAHFFWLLLLRGGDYKLKETIFYRGENFMAKDVINVDGKDTVVREDTAKAYRGTIWALLSIGAIVIVTAILFFVFFGGSLFTDDLQSPKEIEQKRQ